MTRSLNSSRVVRDAASGGDGDDAPPLLHDGDAVGGADSGRRRSKVARVLTVVAALLLVAAAGAAWWLSRPSSQVYYTDGAAVHEEVHAARKRDVLWQPPIRLSTVLNTTDEDYEPRLSWDENTLYFVRGKPGSNADIHVSHRTPAGFAESQRLEAVCSEYDDLGPEPSRDGQFLYFYSNRPGGCGGYDIWVARNVDGQWQPPTNLGPLVNSEYNDYGPAISPDGTTLYFASNRPQPGDAHIPDPDAWPATVREDLYHRTYDLYCSALADGGPGPATAVGLLNTELNEAAPCVTPSGDFLYFASDRPGGFGGFDLYRARLVRGNLQPAENLGPAINSAANELDPGLASLGFGLYFSSDRPRDRIDPKHPNDYNLYYSASRDVFIETEAAQTARINWAAMWRTILPNLLWGLLALLLLLLLIALCWDARRRRLSLLTRCLLASLAMHALLLFILSFWKVTAVVVDAVRGRGEIQVAVTPRDGGDSLMEQIRGSLTDLAAPQAAAATEIPARPTAEPDVTFTPTHFDVPRTLPTPDSLPLLVQTEDADLPLPEMRETATIPDIPASSSINVALPAEELPRAVAPEATYQPSAAAPSSDQAAAPAVPSPDMASEAVLPVVRPTGVIQDDTVSFVDRTPSDLAQPLDHERPSAPQPAANTPTASLTLALPEESPASRQSTAESEIHAVAAPPDTESKPAPASPGPAGVTSDTQFALTAPPAHPGKPAVLPGSLSLPPDASVSPAGGFLTTQPAPDVPRHEIDNLRLPGLTAKPASMPAGEASWSPKSVAVAASSGANLAPIVSGVPATSAKDAGRIDVAPSLPKAGSESSFVSVPAMLPPDSRIEPSPSSALAGLRLPGTQAEAALPTLRLPDEVAASAADATKPLAGDGNPGAESAVEKAIAWLAAHQSADGHWDGAAFDAACGGCGGETSRPMNVTLTGLATLAFIGAGHTHAADGPYRDNVQRALSWLKARQQPDGDLRGDETMYSHAIGTTALAEALAATRDSSLRDAVRRAVEVITSSPGLSAGPDDKAGSIGDTAVLGWQVMALHSARQGGVQVPPEPLAAARRWLARVEDAKTPGVYSYQPGYPPSESMTAEGLFVQLALGVPRDDPRTLGAISFLKGFPPAWNPEPDPYYWYFATLALFHVRGEPWARWNEAITTELLRHQETSGKRAGSWPPDGRSAAVGGRVYQTALCALVLETNRKLLPMLAAVREDSRGGKLSGRVTFSTTAKPLAGALVRADLSDAVPVAAYTLADGSYEMALPEMPTHFALTASHPYALPKTENVSSAALQAGGLVVDFQLEPRERDRIVLEPEPDVHHLGNDRFEGRINSQFQKRSEGLRYRVTFELPTAPSSHKARLKMMTRGVQCPHPITINNEEVAELRRSPGDGSFGRYVASFDSAILEAGPNVLEIRAVSCMGDIDDFEFVNVQIELVP